MFDHVTIGVSDHEASRRFYATVLATLGHEMSENELGPEWDDFSLMQAGDDRAVTTGLHLGFRAPSHEHVRAFWQAGVDAGYASDGRPGPRPEYGPDYFGGFLLDPDGNSAEAVVHDNLRAEGVIDHLWIRVADHDASRAFYATVAPVLGFHAVADEEHLTRFSPGPHGGSFSVLTGSHVTSPLHLAFPAPDHATVERFHEAALAAGHPDNGAPGERAVYHPGYYGAFVLDPDGHNVEAVDHGR